MSQMDRLGFYTDSGLDLNAQEVRELVTERDALKAKLAAVEADAAAMQLLGDALAGFYSRPWYFDQRNSKGVVIKSNTGEVVWAFDAGSIPDEWPASMREIETAAQWALGDFLVSWSKQKPGTGQALLDELPQSGQPN